MVALQRPARAATQAGGPADPLRPRGAPAGGRPPPGAGRGGERLHRPVPPEPRDRRLRRTDPDRRRRRPLARGGRAGLVRTGLPDRPLTGTPPAPSRPPQPPISPAGRARGACTCRAASTTCSTWAATATRY
ncbi:hypothetical protein KCH_62490 [Kitasatospora cheerisanensis KCTC 2395]|uniref:Uncharacterized protein n=1 Tax=Kitasatospora cheerisanensis KCTC 2395 TaxID=1348663 RepID=A0A066YVX9_9ACTN|nr:hypothetical protein KCH_62490 [Kitasatospora cheerisanensis KCTC 2395]